jgi:DNA-binding beta-propeller fold protein YncE
MRKPSIRLGLVAVSIVALVGGIACTDDEATTTGGGSNEAATIVQAGQLQPAVSGEVASGWATEESIRGGLELVATYDSSGPDAWDMKAHPLVYVTSIGQGYAHRPSATNKLPGVQVVDADSKETVASALFDLGGTPTRQPHGLGVSPDGQWAYIGYAYDDEQKVRQNVTLVVNLKTLKLDKVLKQSSWYEGKMRSQDVHHFTSFVDFEGNDRVVLEYGFGATGGPHFILDPKDDNRVWRALTYDDIRPIGHPYLSADVTGQYLFVSMGSNWIREMEGHAASIAKYDLKDGTHTVITGVGSHPIGTASTSDGKFLYVADGHGSFIYKIDLETNEVVAKASAGVAGPYGIRLSYDQTLLYIMGKGEGTHNVGGGVTVMDLKTMSVTKDVGMPIETGGQIIDHGILHPDPDKNELWISSSGTFETIVLDVATKQVTARIPVSFGGDTHSGAFVRYAADGTGAKVMDHGTPGPEGW